MTDRLNNRVYAIIVLTLATAVIHLALSFNPLNPLFILNAIGYIALLIGLYFIPSFSESLRNIIRWVFIGYTAVTIVLYFVFNGAGAWTSAVGLLDKGIELVLIILLWLDRDN